LREPGGASVTAGLLAGAGRLPAELLRGARATFARTAVVGFRGVTDPGLEAVADRLRWLPLGQVQAVFDWLRAEGVRDVALAGKLDPAHLHGPLELDERGRALLAGLADRRDDSLLAAVARAIEAEGFVLHSQLDWAPELAVPLGPAGSRLLDEPGWRDARLGWEAATALGRAGVGQTVVVAAGRIVAVEASEGTDDTIARGGRLAGPGAVVVKRTRPGQDARFDLPTVGRRTLEGMIEAGARALVLEAGRSLWLDREPTLALAEAHGIAVVGVPASGPPPPRAGDLG